MAFDRRADRVLAVVVHAAVVVAPARPTGRDDAQLDVGIVRVTDSARAAVGIGGAARPSAGRKRGADLSRSGACQVAAAVAPGGAGLVLLLTGGRGLADLGPVADQAAAAARRRARCALCRTARLLGARSAGAHESGAARLGGGARRALGPARRRALSGRATLAGGASVPAGAAVVDVRREGHARAGAVHLAGGAARSALPVAADLAGRAAVAAPAAVVRVGLQVPAVVPAQVESVVAVAVAVLATCVCGAAFPLAPHVSLRALLPRARDCVQRVEQHTRGHDARHPPERLAPGASPFGERLGHPVEPVAQRARPFPPA
jgi:hypothetical protein